MHAGGPDPARAEREAFFLAALPRIEEAIRIVARRNRLSGAEAEDFGSEIKLALIENDYDVLARFQGRSSLRTYLLTVVQRRFLDRRRRQWGKWRPSPQAERLGPVALRLEALLYRDRLPLAEAVETLRLNLGVDETAEALVALAHRLPVRAARRTAESLDGPERPEPAAPVPDDPHAGLEARETAARCQAAVARAMAALAPDDRVVLRLRFEDGVSVADIARARRLDQKKLYRRLDAMLASFREVLERQSLAWDDVRAWIERGQCHLRLPPPAGAEIGGAVPSLREERGD